MRINLTILCFLLFSANAFSQNSKAPVRLCPEDVKWTDAKPPLVGASVMLLEGNPKDTGHFTMRIKLPPHFKIAPHTHPVDECTTVISGSISTGMGEVMDTLSARKMTAGCFYVNPANMAHYAFTNETETIVQISTDGPWGSKPIGK